MKKIGFGFVAAAMLSMCGSAMAAKDADGPGGACSGLKIATGNAGKGYSKLFQDIQRACGNEVSVCEVNTNGGLDNLSALSTKEADVGFAQVDTWSTMKNGDDNIASLQGVMGVNSNYLHVVTAAGGYTIPGEDKWGGLKKGDPIRVVINRFSDLRGKRVALVGSAQLLGRQLSKQLNMQMNIVDVDTDAAAFEMVKKGTVAATLSVSGWPSGALKNLKQNSGLTLVPFDMALNGAGYGVRPINYKGLGVYNNNALAMPNVLFTRPFKGEKAGEVSKLRSCITSKLQELQEGDFEPAWNEIKDPSSTYGVPRFGGATTKPAGK